MRPNAGQAVTPQLRVWMVLPAARAAAGPAGGGRGEPGQVPAVGPVAGEDLSRAPGPGRGGVCAPVEQAAGSGAFGVDAAAVRAGRAGGGAGLGTVAHRGDR